MNNKMYYTTRESDGYYEFHLSMKKKEVEEFNALSKRYSIDCISKSDFQRLVKSYAEESKLEKI